MPMGWVAAGSALIGAAGSMTAANTQANAQNNATSMQQSMFNTVTANSQPYMQSGDAATSDLSQLMGISGTPGSTVAGTGLQQGSLAQTFNPTQAQLEQYPGYQFALQQGGQATRNADTPGVGALSGAALKDLTNFDVGTASQYYNQDFNQFQTQQSNIYNRLSGIAGLGQSAAVGVGNSGTQLGIGAAQSTAAAGASQAGGIVGATNAASTGATNLASLMYLNSQNGSTASPYAASGGGVGTGAYDMGGTTYNNPSAYVGGGG